MVGEPVAAEVVLGDAERLDLAAARTVEDEDPIAAASRTGVDAHADTSESRSADRERELGID